MLATLASPLIYIGIIVLLTIFGLDNYPYYNMNGYGIIAEPIAFALAISIGNFERLNPKFSKIGSLVALLISFYIISLGWSYMIEWCRGYKLHTITEPFMRLLGLSKNYSHQVLVALSTVPATLAYYFACNILFDGTTLRKGLIVIATTIPVSIYLMYLFTEGALIVSDDSLSTFQYLWPLAQCIFFSIAIQAYFSKVFRARGS